MVLFLKNILEDRGERCLVLVTSLQTEGMTTPQLSLRVLAGSKCYGMTMTQCVQRAFRVLSYKSLLSRMTKEREHFK